MNLKPGQYVGQDGKVYGWTGRKCPSCFGIGCIPDHDGIERCAACAGTGDEHNEISDGAMYAAHSRSLLTPEQNAAIDADFDARVRRDIAKQAWRDHVDAVLTAEFGHRIEPSKFRAIDAVITLAGLSCLVSLLVYGLIEIWKHWG